VEYIRCGGQRQSGVGGRRVGCRETLFEVSSEEGSKVEAKKKLLVSPMAWETGMVGRAEARV
jgi:hypothetical protein